MPRVNASMRCKPGDDTCFARLAAKIIDPGPTAYPLQLLSITSEVLVTPEGGKVTFRVVVRNPTDRTFGSFDTMVSPAVILQGRPVERPPSYLLHVDTLGPGETGFFYTEALPYEMPSGGLFSCLDRDFNPGT
jgi:hypothetical protein